MFNPLPLEPTDENSTYLGDGAYVTVDVHGDWFIWTDRDNGRHWVAIDEHGQRSLLRLYAEKVAG
jgi:hypothetical protein